MNCEEATKLMDGYLDGELDPITSQTIEQHLREGRNCDQAYKTHGSLIRLVEIARTSEQSGLVPQAPRVVVNRKLRVTNDVDEEDRRDFELDLFFNLRGHIRAPTGTMRMI